MMILMIFVILNDNKFVVPRERHSFSNLFKYSTLGFPEFALGNTSSYSPEFSLLYVPLDNKVINICVLYRYLCIFEPTMHSKKEKKKKQY